MRYAIIVSGTVTNVVAAEPDFAASQGWIAAGDAGPGWRYDGGTFHPPAPAPERDLILRALAASDAEVSPRWLEDAVAGVPPHQSYLDWSARRAALRARLAELDGA